MLKKLGLIALGLLVGIIIGGVGTMAYAGFGLAHGMFMLQDTDIIRAEDAATQAYLNESPEIGIWAINNYLDYFESVIYQRTEAIEKTNKQAQEVFLIADPKSRWISYVRLGLLYEKLGNDAKKKESFEKAADLFGQEVKDGTVEEYMTKVVKQLDKNFNPIDMESK